MPSVRDGLSWLIGACVKSPSLRLVLHYLGLRPVLSGLLRVRPAYGMVPSTSLVYRVSSAADLLTSKEIFHDGEYGALKELGTLDSFVDAGCNCGYFALFAASLGRSTSVSALAIDAHPDMIAATQWHLDRNGLHGIRPVWGVLGSPQAEYDTFYLHVDSPGSSRFPQTPRANVTPRPWRQIAVPTVSLADEWKRHFGSMGCDVLKIDVEGSELDLIRAERAFLPLVAALVVEIHKWLISVTDVESALGHSNFEHHKTLREDPNVYIALYLNRTGRYAHLLSPGT